MRKKGYLLFLSILLLSCSKEIIQHTLTVDALPVNAGSVSPPSNAFEKGSVVTLIATPAAEYLFKQWQGGLSGISNPAPITVDSDKQVTAVFEKRQYPLSLTIEGNGSVKEEIVPIASQAVYPSGTTVRLTAQAGPNWKFKAWQGDKVSTASPIDVKVDAPLTLKAVFSPILPNYLGTSYELSNSKIWFSSEEIINENGSRYTMNPLIDEQSAQFDMNQDGYEDIFYYEGYDLNISPTPNPPPTLLLNKGGKLVKSVFNGPNIKNPHGTKLLVGDFNGDALPDVFSTVAIDPPFNSPAGFLNTYDNSHLLFNSPNGFSRVKEFTDEGFWYTGCSGDIDKDGDVDIIVFNFHNQANKVKSRIMWNNGQGEFTIDTNGVGDIPVVYQSELVDLNNDGNLDLVITFIPNGNPRTNDFRILWGNGQGFSLTNSTKIDISSAPTSYYVQNLDFVDLDGDGAKEILPSGNYDNPMGGVPIYFVDVFKSDDGGKTYRDRTSTLMEKNKAPRFYHIRIADVDSNGKMDVFSADKKDNIRWEWDGSKLVRK